MPFYVKFLTLQTLKQTMKKILKKMFIGIIATIAILVAVYFLIVNFYPSFGGDVGKKRQELYGRQSTHYKNGKFWNTNANAPREQSFTEILKIARKFFFEKVKNGRPNRDLTPVKLDSTEVANYHKNARLIWYGHSAFLLQMDGKNLLLDPMFGKVAAPLEMLGEKRFNSELPLEIAKLPKIDAIIFSHDHYDHLDYGSVMKLKTKTEHFFVPLGVGVHLEAWGIHKDKITELDWWQETEFKNLKFVCTPAQHFSGRKINNRMSTLWSSWVIQSENENIYFSGDGGYAPHFKKIGEKYGPFDIALMECGQYNKMWADIHMMPEETAQAGVDVKAKKIMPIHWAGFKLAMHSWTDPIERVSAKAKELNLPLVTPKIGEEILVKDSIKVYGHWWNKY